MNPWNFKSDAEPQGSSNGFWYDIAEGGYIDPAKVLAEGAQVAEVTKAVDLLASFEQGMRDRELINEF